MKKNETDDLLVITFEPEFVELFGLYKPLKKFNLKTLKQEFLYENPDYEYSFKKSDHIYFKFMRKLQKENYIGKKLKHSELYLGNDRDLDLRFRTDNCFLEEK